MKRKTLLPSLSLASLLVFVAAGCGQRNATEAKHGHEGEEHEETGVSFAEGKGLEMHAHTQKALGVTTVDATERKVAPTFTVHLQVYREASELIPASTESKAEVAYASGFISAEQANQAKIGQPVILAAPRGGGEQGRGTLVRLDRSTVTVIDQLEALVEIPDPQRRYRVGTFLEAMFTAANEQSVIAVPRSALLKTAAGTFVYVVNGKHFLRTAVKTGVQDGEYVEIADGLYAGDQVVKQPVLSLWLAELQAVKGGVGCAHGH